MPEPLRSLVQPPRTPTVSRRRALRWALLGAGGLTVAGGLQPEPSRTERVRPAGTDTAAALAALEAKLPGRVGVYAVDTGSGATVGHRADERFLLCSTGKALTVAAVLHRAAREPALPGRLVQYTSADILDYAPITRQHVEDGMTVADLCDAAITVSDNTAANLLVQLLGGPPAVTAFARSLGDDVTRVDRLEPDLNVTSPGDERDTSTPAQMADDLRTLTLTGGVLAAAERARYVGLLKANTTGGQCIRAGLPAGWAVGDKTGSGAQGESNDLAIVWPPGRAPLIIAVYTAPDDPNVPVEHAHSIIAEAAAIAAAALVPR